jgi:hypothetical protein
MFSRGIDDGAELSDGIVDGDRRRNKCVRGHILDFVKKALLDLS